MTKMRPSFCVHISLRFSLRLTLYTKVIARFPEITLLLYFVLALYFQREYNIEVWFILFHHKFHP